MLHILLYSPFMAIVVELERKPDQSNVRNSDWRKLTTVADPLIPWLHNKSKGRLKAWQISVLGLGLSIGAIEIAKYQNRTGRYTAKRTALALGMKLLADGLDLIDGKYARYERSLMTDPDEKDRHEMIGQALDPVIDGAAEAYQKASSAITAWRHGDAESKEAALRDLCRTNLPRTAKAVVGSLGVAVPESYQPWDIKFYGTSLGRKIPNYISIFINRARGIPIQGILDTGVETANELVAMERISTLWQTNSDQTLNEKEIRHAKFRAKVLATQSLINIGIAHILRRVLR